MLPPSPTGAVKRRTEALTRLGKRRLRVLEQHPTPPAAWRPRTRADCANVPRPCPYVGCRHHLALDVDPTTGNICRPHGDAEPEELPVSCSLDLAEHGAMTLDLVGSAIGVTRERARQIEAKALDRALAALHRMGLTFADLLQGEPEGWPVP